MDITLVKKKRKLLEQDIAKLVTKFSRETGTEVKRLNLNRITTSEFSSTREIVISYNVYVDAYI